MDPEILSFVLLDFVNDLCVCAQNRKRKPELVLVGLSSQNTNVSFLWIQGFL